MNFHEFIFSNQTRYRLARHLAFWLIFTLHFIVQNLMVGGAGEGKTHRTFEESFLHSLYFLPVYLFATYLLVEFLLPTFLYRGQYPSFFVSAMLLFTVSFIGVYYSGMLYLQQLKKLPFGQIDFQANKYHVLVNGLFVPFMLYGIATGVKLSKKWFLQQRENERLAKQKLATELQLLKTSIHPRFLFHSLHTVEKHIDSLSAQSPALILQLSDLLSYILYENEAAWVPLEKELEIIRGYINLEEKGFGNSGFFKTTIPGNTRDKFVVPFLLLSLVENSFEYFFETGQQRPDLSLTISIQENVLQLDLRFSRPVDEPDTALVLEKFSTAQKQLQNQYLGLHHLELLPDARQVFIKLKLPLYTSDLIDITRNSLNEVSEPV